MTNPTLVLFDIDGTLLNSGGCGRAATELALQDVFGTRGNLDNVNFAGKTDWGILRESLPEAGFTQDEIDARLEQHNHTVGLHLHAIVTRFPVRACPGAPDVIAALHAKPDVVLGLMTGNMQTLVPIKLRAAGYDPAVFRVGAFGSEGWERAMLPPLALARAQALTGIEFAPEQVVILGDTPDDITCAETIGARTIALATGPFSVEQLRAYHPTHVFETMQPSDVVVRAILDHQHG